MDNLSNTYYLFRLIVEEIFVYLRDIILHEFGWLDTDFENSEAHESRAQRTIFTHPLADFAALFIICIILGICVLLSTKPDKDVENCPLVDESDRVKLPEDRTYKLPPTLNVGNFSAASGDASNEADAGFIPGYAEELEYPMSGVSPAGSCLYNVHHAHSQSTQTSSRALRRAAGAHEWLIRRTRSGHVYGKYPM